MNGRYFTITEVNGTLIAAELQDVEKFGTEENLVRSYNEHVSAQDGAIRKIFDMLGQAFNSNIGKTTLVKVIA